MRRTATKSKRYTQDAYRLLIVFKSCEERKSLGQEAYSIMYSLKTIFPRDWTTEAFVPGLYMLNAG